MLIEAMGADRFFSQLKGKVIHADIDGCGNPRQLVRMPLEETATGFVQAVHVICPTTHREYYLGVPPDVETCQGAVAATFKIKTNEYNPERES